MLAPWKKSYDKPRQSIKKQRHYFPNKGPSSQVIIPQQCPMLRHPMDCSPWNFPDLNTGLGSPSLLQGIFPSQGPIPGLLYCRWIHYQLSHQGSPHPPIVKAMVFPIVIYGCESWTIKKADHRRIDAVKLWYWRRPTLLRVPWTARRSNQSILKEISPEYSLEGLMLKLKLQYFWSADTMSLLIRKDPDAVKDWGQEKGMTEDEMVGWHHWLNGHEFGKLREMVMDNEALCTMVHGVAKSRTQLSNWAPTKFSYLVYLGWVLTVCTVQGISSSYVSF